jgi:hypothetical protein
MHLPLCIFTYGLHSLLATELSEEIYHNHSKKVTNIDLSDVVIAQMEEKYSALPGMQCT